MPYSDDTSDEVEIVSLYLWCPRCDYLHVDEDEWYDRKHRTHLCALCQHTWRVKEYYTRGVSVEQALNAARRILLTHLLCQAFKLAGLFEPELFVRAGGECLCTICSKPYWRHPQDPVYEWLEVLCDGTRVKL